MDLNHRPPGPEPGALARLRYAPTDKLGPNLRPKRDSQINIPPWLLLGRPSQALQIPSRLVAFVILIPSHPDQPRQKAKPPEGSCLPAAFVPAGLSLQMLAYR
jgi:hypothetical protein